MRLGALATGAVMTARTLGRNRIALLLLVLIPALFLAFVELTTTDRPITFALASAGPGSPVLASQRHEALVFVGLAAVGVLTAFLALDLLQRDLGVTHRLVRCGYRPREIVAARLAVLVLVVVLIATLLAAIVRALFAPANLAAVWAGFLLGGWVYGCYGLLAGALVRRELEGILVVVLLANLDVGWLQNPIYYADAPHQAVIRVLPAHYPSQVSMLAAFTDQPVGGAAARAFAYGAVLLAVALFVFHRRMRGARV